MAMRFYLTNVIGAGTPANPFRPATETVLPCRGMEDGRLDDTVAAGRMFVGLDVTDAEHVEIMLITNVTYIPFEDAGGVPLQTSDAIGLIPAARRTAIRNALDAAGIDTDDLTLSDPIWKVIKRIRQRFKLRNSILRALDFVEGFDTTIGDIPAARRQQINTRLQLHGFDTSGLALTDTIRQALRKLFAQRHSKIDVVA